MDREETLIVSKNFRFKYYIIHVLVRSIITLVQFGTFLCSALYDDKYEAKKNKYQVLTRVKVNRNVYIKTYL